MTMLSKHAEARAVFGSDFTAQMAEGDSLAGEPTVRIVRDLVDHTAEFLLDPSDAAIVGKTVTFTLRERADGTKQQAGFYTVLVRCATNNELVLVDTWTLAVDCAGEVAAP